MRAPLAAVAALLATLVLGMWLGGHSTFLPEPLRDVVRSDDQQVVDDAVAKIKDDYYRKIPGDELSNEAIRGMVTGLDDRFSAYFDPKEYDEYREQTDARFFGVGMNVQAVKRGLLITHVYDKSPARSGGLRTGDVIVAADGASLAGKTAEYGSTKIKGPAGTKVRLAYERSGKKRSVELTRAEVSVPVVASKVERRGGKKYAVIRLATFSSGAHAEVYAAVRKAVEQEKVAGIVFDLRHNGGGLVEEARLIASAFIRDGKIVTTKGRSVAERVYRATGKPVAADIPLVVLVDRGTASASEIVAGALQDTKRARVVGTRTFGKGVFQEVVELQNGGALDITVGQYFLPSGRNLGGKGTKTGSGLTPDVQAQDKTSTPRDDEGVDAAVKALATAP
jgi:carboxyl-terminal processing protease